MWRRESWQRKSSARPEVKNERNLSKIISTSSEHRTIWLSENATASSYATAIVSTTTAGHVASPTCGLTACGLKVGKGGLCSRCRSINYCSKEHQRRDWQTHKLMCRAVKKGDPLCTSVKDKQKAEKVSREEKLSPKKKQKPGDYSKKDIFSLNQQKIAISPTRPDTSV